MKSIKPIQSILAVGKLENLALAVSGVLWILTFASTGAPLFFTLLGGILIILAIVLRLYHYIKNRNILTAVNSNRNKEKAGRKKTNNGFCISEADFCPNCENNIKSDFIFCPMCGKRIK